MSQFPNPATQFKPGQSGNPGGKTREHRQAEIRAAELAAKAQLDLVEALSDALDNAKNNEEKLEQIRSDVLKLLKDSQDRGFGAPTQPTEISNPDGSLAPHTVKIVAVAPDANSDG